MPTKPKTETLEHLPVDALVPYARNTRTHSAEQVAQLAAAIREFGFTNPVLIDGEGGIIAGHGRIMAAQQLGMDTVPCRRLTHLTDAQKRAYIIADNKLALNAGWDEQLLAEEFTALGESSFDLGLTGFDTSEIDALLNNTASTMTRQQLQSAEGKTDHAPNTEPAFQAEMARTDTKGLAPIVPIYAERQSAFVIVCDDQIDEAWLRNKLGLEDVHQSYKSDDIQRCNVTTVAKIRERLQ